MESHRKRETEKREAEEKERLREKTDWRKRIRLWLQTLTEAYIHRTLNSRSQLLLNLVTTNKQTNSMTQHTDTVSHTHLLCEHISKWIRLENHIRCWASVCFALLLERIREKIDAQLKWNRITYDYMSDWKQTAKSHLNRKMWQNA